MVVRIRLGHSAPLSRRRGKNSRAARLAASLLTIVSISVGSLGLWRIGADLGWTGDFVFTNGILSHWQVWIAGACASQYVAWQLSRYARKATEPSETTSAAEPLPAPSNV